MTLLCLMFMYNSNVPLKTFKLHFQSRFHIWCLPNCCGFYLESFRDTQTPPNTFSHFALWPLTSPAVQFILHRWCNGHDFWAFACYHWLIETTSCIHLFRKLSAQPTSSPRKGWSFLFYWPCVMCMQWKHTINSQGTNGHSVFCNIIHTDNGVTSLVIKWTQN